MRNFTLKPNHKLRILNKGALVVAGVSLAGLIILFIVMINQTQVNKTSASQRMSDKLNNGDVITYFNWDENPATKTAWGTPATGCTAGVHAIVGGKDESYGLSPGGSKKDINLILTPEPSLNPDGIDISLDYRRNEESGNFYTRGSAFNFGMKKGKLQISYKTTDGSGVTNTINEITSYLIPEDNTYRNYRFIYDPATGKGEIFVNEVPVWTRQTDHNYKLFWNKTEPGIIGYGMNGNGIDKAIMDNFTIRTTSKANQVSYQILSFSAEMENGNVKVSWITGFENTDQPFIIERSTDAKVFKEIGRLNSVGTSNNPIVYELTDRNPVEGILYYRLTTPSVIKTGNMPVIAMRYKNAMNEQTENKNINQQK
jgi:hypothetical protein